jgi:peptide/nickel transport system permease protein
VTDEHPFGPDLASRTPWQWFWRRLAGDRVALVALGFLVALVLAATLGAPLSAALTGRGPTRQVDSAVGATGLPIGPFERTFGADSITHNPHGALFVLGADSIGRDMLVRLLYGARVSLIVGVAATGVALAVGVVLGLVAGWLGGVTDAVISRGIETGMAFPALLLAIGLAVVVGPGLVNVILIIAAFTWYYPARIVRGEVLRLRSSMLVEAARSLGASDARILRHHVLPQLTAPVVVYTTTIVAGNIMFEAGLSYLGVGVPPPTASWGQMLSDSIDSGLFLSAPFLAIVPGLALVLTILAFNILGDGVRDALYAEAA